MELSASLVLYRNNPEVVRRAVMSLLNTPIKISLSVVDNSPLPELAQLFEDLEDFKVDYFYNNGENVGFGKAHNLALRRVQKCDYHLVMNPDVYFEENVIIELIEYLKDHQDVGLVGPKVYEENGEIQYVCRRYPTVWALLVKRFTPKRLKFLFQKTIDWYEMRDTGYNQIMEAPVIGGCFMLFRRKCLDEIGYFDENIFMYFEDYDLTVRMAKKYKTIFYPFVQIYHLAGRGAYKSIKLATIFMLSGMYFFSKHGWRLF